MITKSKIAVIAAIAALSFASPALAQSFDNDFGTGNEQPSYYDSHGGLHAGTPSAQLNFVANRGGMSAYASVGRSSFASESNAGGGSVGYNEMLKNDRW